MEIAVSCGIGGAVAVCIACAIPDCGSGDATDDSASHRRPDEVVWAGMQTIGAWLEAAGIVRADAARALEREMRLLDTARYAHEHGFRVIATTLASSRWKSLEQIDEAGRYAVSAYPDVVWWGQNWRKGGLSERRAAIIKEYNFYNQRYCGCEFSMRKADE